MADILNNIGQGAVGGGLTGAAFGPWGALAGIVGGGILGAFTEDPPTADELGIKPIDSRQMAQEFLPSEDEMRTQRNDAATRSDQSSERSAENMIAAGMDPARAYAIADRNSAPNATRIEQTQNAQKMTMMDSLAMQFKPYEMQRDEDILNYNMSIENQPGILESFIPIAADLWGSQGLSNWGSQGLSNWGGGAPKRSGIGIDNEVETLGSNLEGVLSGGYNAPFNPEFRQFNTLSQPNANDFLGGNRGWQDH